MYKNSPQDRSKITTYFFYTIETKYYFIQNVNNNATPHCLYIYKEYDNTFFVVKCVYLYEYKTLCL